MGKSVYSTRLCFKNFSLTTVGLLVLLCLPNLSSAQKFQKLNLGGLFRSGKLQVVNRTVKTDVTKKEAVVIDEKAGEGVVWIKDLSFAQGTIELDMKGKDVLQRSFVGIAFHALNDSTYDAIYFRPFNFRATDSVRRIHAVQYIAHPVYTWKKLRDEQNARFEKAVSPAPDPNDWFHARIEVKDDLVKVYVNDSKTPSLSVKRLNVNKKGTLGLWVGDGSGGTFANLVVKHSIKL